MESKAEWGGTHVRRTGVNVHNARLVNVLVDRVHVRVHHIAVEQANHSNVSDGLRGCTGHSKQCTHTHVL